MELSINTSGINENTLIWAIVCSILLHALLAITLPNFEFGKEKKPQELIIEIQQPKPPEPAAEVLPEEPKPIEPPKPEPIKKIVEPKLTPKPITKTVEAPSPVQQTDATPSEVETPPQPNVIAVAPTENTTPTTVVATPVAEPPKPVEFSQVDVDNALGEYRNALGRAIAKQKKYPKIAQMRGWQGDVMLDLKLDGNGKVLSATVRESSGHESLDNQALEMVRRASPFPAPSLALRDRTFNITVPVSFKLENP